MPEIVGKRIGLLNRSARKMKKYFAILWIQKIRREKKKNENSVVMREIERDSNKNLLVKFLMTMMKMSYPRKRRLKRQHSYVFQHTFTSTSGTIGPSLTRFFTATIR